MISYTLKFSDRQNTPKIISPTLILFIISFTIIHTIGRDLEWNPHVHAIVTLKDFNKNYNNKIKAQAYAVVNQLYKKDIHFFFNATKNDLNNGTNAIKYIHVIST